MKILITGGTGLVGSAFKNILNKYSYEFYFLSSKECDLSDYKQTFTFLNNYKPDYVIHLAAYVGGLFKNMNYKVDMLEKNILINYNILKCCHEVKVKKVISCLSTCIFPDKTNYPINENMLHNGPPHYSNDAYAHAKRLLEIHSIAYQEQYNDNFICVIPTNIYGENDNYSLEDGHVIPALIHRCYLAKKNKEKFIVRGSGKHLRQFIFSEDLAKLIMWVLEYYEQKESIILSVGEKDEVSIEYVARQIAKFYDYEHMIEFDTSYSDGQFKKTADNSKLTNLYGEFKFMNIDEGIKKSVKWFINNYNTCRK
jgi:GDP-L-fucose synthase